MQGFRGLPFSRMTGRGVRRSRRQSWDPRAWSNWADKYRFVRRGNPNVGVCRFQRKHFLGDTR